MLGMLACACNPNSRKQRQKNPGTSWPVSLVELVSSESNEPSCLKTRWRLTEEGMWAFNPAHPC